MTGQKIKILLVTSRADYGGGPEHVFRLLSGLKNDFDFFVACPFEEPYFEKYQNNVLLQKMISIPHRKFTFSDLSRIKSFILKNDIQIIHSHGKGAGIYSRILAGLTNTKCIHTFHGVHINQYNGLSKTVYKIIERFLKKRTNAFVSVSQSEYESVLKNKFADKNKLHVIENGVAIPDVSINENVFYTKPLLITSITRFDYAKNSSLVINILDHLAKTNSPDQFKFIFIGKGPEEYSIKIKLKEKKLSSYVEFTGNLSNPEEILNKSFCYVSTSRWEGLPLGMLEAMAIGLPCIATNVTGNRDIVINQVNGFLFNLTEPQMAANYLTKLSDDLNLWRKFSTNARNLTIEKYSLGSMLEKTKNLYEEINRT
ncbi:MAG TPA: glycosyltransferase [Ignavibacteriaceae bacterium]|nr:glycosyltransferase [Ignavibacteriaceae bacterium]